MAYCTLEQVKLYLKQGNSYVGDDDFLEMLIPMVKSEIDSICKRHFDPITATRKYKAKDIRGKRLLLDDDIISITTVTNGDGQVISSANYERVPLNGDYGYGILLTTGSWNTNANIQVVGVWGFVENGAVPPMIELDAIRATAWRYKQRAAPFETRGLVDGGITVVPTPLPVDIRASLAKLERRTPQS